VTRISDTQAVILSAAAQRHDGAVLPPPESLKIKGGAIDKVLGSLKAKRLIEHQGKPRGDDPPPLRITRAGLEAIGVTDHEPDTAPVQPADAPQGAPDAQEAGRAGQEPQAPAEPPQAATATASAKGRAQAAKPAKVKVTKTAMPTKAAPAEKPAPRAGTKQALMIELLRRPEGATVAQIAVATGWQHHTIRGAISGALKKKLGLTIEATRTPVVGPEKTGAKGSTTVYRIIDRSAS
jgi:Protein of unknown function (DUF3489)